MTSVLEQPALDATEPKTIEKVAIVVSKGSLEGVYPALIMANGARMDGIEADLFLTFFGLDTKMMQRQMEKIGIPPIPEFIELVHDSGVHLYACKASVDMFGLTMDDFVPQVEDIISVGEFYEKAAGGQIIFT